MISVDTMDKSPDQLIAEEMGESYVSLISIIIKVDVVQPLDFHSDLSIKVFR